MGIIDTLSAGFNTVLQHLWMIAIPVLLDVSLWLAPKLSVAPVVDELLASLRMAVSSYGTAVGGDASLSQLVASLDILLQETISRTNLMSTLNWGRLGVPGIAGARQIELGVDRVIGIGSYGRWLGIEVGLLLVGLLIACLFLGMLGQVVRGEGLRLGKLVRRLPTYWLYMLAFLIPLGALLFGVLLSSVVLGALSFMFWSLALWLLVYVSFVPQAITMSEERPLQALVASLAIVRRSFWATFGLLALTNLIALGLGWVWMQLGVTTLGTVAAIVLNAFVGTGLTTARFIFFRDRMAALRAASQPLRSA